jgi:hypothetical protein
MIYFTKKTLLLWRKVKNDVQALFKTVFRYSLIDRRTFDCFAGSVVSFDLYLSQNQAEPVFHSETTRTTREDFYGVQVAHDE